ncbi:MAG: helix-turn-helix transcriptional regulator [Candidatus Bathyarchaeota archaeon]|nr:helix-turn-helix transcriptional regulator [Candidatus Bathyarchaeota archaeon]
MRTRIKELRAREGLTQADLSKKVGCRRETISFVEKAEYNPSLLLAVRIAKVFGEAVENVFIFEAEDLAL